MKYKVSVKTHIERKKQWKAVKLHGWIREVRDEKMRLKPNIIIKL